MKRGIAFLVGVVVLGTLTALPAAAVTVTPSFGTTTSTPGAVTFWNFDGTADVTIGTVTGGDSNVGANPGGGGNWRTAYDVPTDITVTFANPTTYLGFLWGTQDSYNSVTLFNGVTNLGTFGPPPGGNINIFGNFANFTAGAGEQFTRALLSSPGCCFEVDNFAAIAAVSPVPVPPALALFATGLAGLGWLARRRKKQAA